MRIQFWIVLILRIKSFQFRPGLSYHAEEINLTGKAAVLQTLTYRFNLGSLLIYIIHANENIHFLEVKQRWVYLHDKPDYKNVERVAKQYFERF